MIAPNWRVSPRRDGRLADYYTIPIAPYLRDPPAGIRRSAYEADINPWSRRGEVEAALLFRGAIVSAYGYIETRMGELALRISKMAEYQDLRESFPYRTDQRVSYMRRAFARPPLNAFERIAAQALSRFEIAGTLRNQAAHARMTVMPDWGVTFDDYDRVDGEVHTRLDRYPLMTLEGLAWQAARRSRLCQRLLDNLEQTGLLPLLD